MTNIICPEGTKLPAVVRVVREDDLVIVLSVNYIFNKWYLDNIPDKFKLAEFKTDENISGKSYSLMRFKNNTLIELFNEVRQET